MRIVIPRQAHLPKLQARRSTGRGGARRSTGGGGGGVRMIRPSCRTHEHLFWSISSHPHPSLQASRGLLHELSISMVPGDWTPAMIDQAQRARMIRNPERAFHLLQNRKPLVPKAERDTSGFCLQSGGQFTGQTGVIDLLYARKVSTCFAPVRSFQKTGDVQTECLLLDGSGSLLRSQHGHDADVEENNKVEADPAKVIQEFDYVVVIDFEATCDKNMEKFKPQEIIEFPSVLVNCQCLILEDCFQTYVKPVHHPVLTSFCTRLTGIQQEQVDRGIALVEALDRHDQWLQEKGVKDKKFAILIWSDWDCKVMLESECRSKGLKKPPYFNRWINLKVLFQNAFMGRKCNLKKAVEVAGLKWTGRAHCGLDDATNTARLALKLMQRGTNLRLTGSSSFQDDGRPQPLVARIRRPQLPSPNLPMVLGGNNAQKPNGTCNSVEVDSAVCFCGVHSRKCMVAKPGPTYGKFFLVCGKWTMNSNHCNFFEWASS